MHRLLLNRAVEIVRWSPPAAVDVPTAVDDLRVGDKSELSIAAVNILIRLGDIFAAHDPRPQALNEGELDPAIVEKEKAVQMDIARESGKPEAVIEKMIVGRMKKWLSDVTLLNQSFVVNPDLTVEKAAEEAGITIGGFARFEVGEGIEVEEEDFAAEVAKTMGG